MTRRVLPGTRGIGVLRDVKDVDTGRRKSSRFGVRAEAAVRAKELPVRENREVGPRLIEHEDAQTRGVERRAAKHDQHRDDGRPMQPLKSDRARLLRRTPQHHHGGARDECARDLPRHADCREADDERWSGEAGRQDQHERSHSDRE